ncbi:hypothetical protein YB2330_005059 [Saitoella coloradoensis]
MNLQSPMTADIDMHDAPSAGPHSHKSFKRKYKKMHARFQDVHGDEDDLKKQLQKARVLARRVAQENAHLLDLLLDLNELGDTPQRITLPPPLESTPEPSDHIPTSPASTPRHLRDLSPFDDYITETPQTDPAPTTGGPILVVKQHLAGQDSRGVSPVDDYDPTPVKKSTKKASGTPATGVDRRKSVKRKIIEGVGAGAGYSPEPEEREGAAGTSASGRKRKKSVRALEADV